MSNFDTLTRQQITEIKHFCTKGPVPAVYTRDITKRDVSISVIDLDYLKANHEILSLRGDVFKLKEYKEWAEAQLDADREAFAKMEYGTPGRRPIIIRVHHKVSKGWFLGWTVEAVDNKQTYTYVLVENQDGTVNKVDLSQITFHDWYTQELNEALEDGETEGSE